MLTFLAYVAGVSVTLLLGIFLFITVYLAYVHHKYSHIPSAKLPSFFLGHIPDIVRLSREHGVNLPFMIPVQYWMQDAKSNTVVAYFFHQARIITADPEVIKAITHNTKNDKPQFLLDLSSSVYGERFLKNGIFLIKHEGWKHKKKIYDPSFHKSYLKTLIKDFNSLADDFLDKLKPLAESGSVVPMADHVHSFTLNVVGRIAFGTDFNKIWNAKSLGLTTVSPETCTVPLSYVVEKVFSGIMEGFFALHPPWLHYFHPFKAKGYQEAVRAIRMMGRDCIQRRMEAIEKGEEVPQDILTNIIRTSELKATQSIEDLVDDFCTFYVAGTETSANLILFTIILIHQHPHVLVRLLEEIEEVLGGRNEVTAEDLDNLTYLEQTINEVHRMYQIVPTIIKCLQNAETICGMHLPKETVFMIQSSAMSYMPRYYEDPDVFNPDRFAPDKKPSSLVYMPFGSGLRSCIGKHFAKMEVKLLLARLLQTYSISLPEDYKLVTIQKTTLQPNDNVPCTLKLLSD